MTAFMIFAPAIVIIVFIVVSHIRWEIAYKKECAKSAEQFRNLMSGGQSMARPCQKPESDLDGQA